MESCDPVSAATHLGMAVWAAFAGLILYRLTQEHGAARRWAVAFYGVSMVTLYVASGAFHGLLALTAGGTSRSAAVDALWVFQKLDKSAIFLLILGSNVPIMVYLLRGRWRAVCLAGMTGFALFGIAALWLLPSIPHTYLVAVYVGMGVCSLIPLRQYWQAVRWQGLGWIGLFAGVYVAGAAAEVFKWPTLVPGWFGPHETLHIADMAGTLIHFAFVVKFVVLAERDEPDEYLTDVPEPVAVG
ncbi:MAG: hemolysin III family protein [Gemmataceae bacterium]